MKGFQVGPESDEKYTFIGIKEGVLAMGRVSIGGEVRERGEKKGRSIRPDLRIRITCLTTRGRLVVERPMTRKHKDLGWAARNAYAIIANVNQPVRTRGDHGDKKGEV